MSEQNPYAPIGTPNMAPPPGVMVPPSGFAPPPPAGGFAPVPQQSYQSPGMALTELSFAPVPTDAPPESVEAAAPPSQSLVSDVLPSGGVARRLSIGGRTPLLALLLVLLLAAGAVVFGTGMLKKKAEAPIVVPKKKAPVVAPSASTPVVVAPVTPAKPKAVAKPVVKPLVGKPLAVTAANSRTFGGTYSVTVPTGWKVALNGGRDSNSNTDVGLTSADGLHQFIVSTARPTVTKGPLTPAKLSTLRAAVLKDLPGIAQPGVVTASVAGARVTGFDATLTAKGAPVTVRTVFFEHAGVVYAAFWASPKTSFASTVPTFNQILATVKFAK